MSVVLTEHKLQIASASDVNTNGIFGNAVDVEGNYAIVTKKGHQTNYNSAYVFKKTGNVWAMHQDLSGQPIGYDGYGLDAKIVNDLIMVSTRTYYTFDPRPSNEKGGIHVFKLNSGTGYFEPYNPAGLDPTDVTKYGDENGNWKEYNFPAGPHARSNIIVSGPNYDGSTNPEDFYLQAIGESNSPDFSYFFDAHYENNVYTLAVGHPSKFDSYIFRHDTTDASKGWLRWRYNPSGVGRQDKSQIDWDNHQEDWSDDIAIYGDFVFISYTSENSSMGKVVIYKYDDTQSNFADKWQQQPDLVPVTRTTGERFGNSLKAFEDYLIVGTQKENSTNRALIYKKDANGDWTNASEKILTPNTEESDSKFGREVSIGKISTEYYAIVGASQKRVNGQYNEGAFYMFKLANGEWNQLNDETDGEFKHASGDNFNSLFSGAISMKGNQIIVGAPGHTGNTTADNSATTYKGAAYIYDALDTGLMMDKINPFESSSNVNILDGALNGTTNNVTLYNEPEDELRTIDRFYGDFILMNDGSVFPSVKFDIDTYANWNDVKYGIYGTANGYAANTPAYGTDLSNVKMISVGKDSWGALFNDGKVVTWGQGDSDSNKSANSYDISNQLINVTKLLFNLNGAAIALKNDGSVVVWGSATMGGSITGDATPAATLGMGNSTLDTGVLDVFCNNNAFTAVKNDGVIVWGKYKNSDYLDDLQGKTWAATNLVKMKYNYENNFFSEYYSNIDDPDKTNGKFLYNTTDSINLKVTELLTAGISQKNIEIILKYPNYYNDLNKIYIPGEFFTTTGIVKNTVRKLLIELIFLLKPKLHEIKNKPENFAFDTKITKPNINIFKPNNGFIDLLKFNNYYDGYYCKFEDTDLISLKSIKNDLYFQIKKSGETYILEKKYGVDDISANDAGPFTTRKLLINDVIIKFSDGIYDGTEAIVQKFNTISTTNKASAYLNSKGKVITWGKSDSGGYSHEEFSLFDSIITNSISSYQLGVDVKSGVIDIVSTESAFAALKKDGSVVTWGNENYGADQSSNNVELAADTYKLYSNLYSFCALKRDGTIVTWGDQTRGGNNAYNRSGGVPTNVVKVFSHKNGFIALKKDKTIVTWGNEKSKINHSTYGVNGTLHNNTTPISILENVLEIYAATSKEIYFAIKTNGDIVKWGESSDSSSYVSSLPFVNAFDSGESIYPLDLSGGLYIISDDATMYNLWDDIKNNIANNITRVVANEAVVACLKNDNTLVVFGSGNNYKKYGGCFDSTDTDVSDNAFIPHSSYIVNKNTLKNIKDIFPGKTGFSAIDISDNVICWGEKNVNYVNNIDYAKIYGGDLSGNDTDKNRPIALFNNGRSWACLKEDERVITWDGTNTTNAIRGSNHTDTTYGVNSTYWGGNNNGGSIRNGDGTNNTLGYIKNIIPYGTDETCSFIAIGEDNSNNKFCVGWGSDDDISMWKESLPNSTGRAFRHIVDKLTAHSKYQVGIFNNIGDNLPYQKTARSNLHEFDFGNQAFTDIETGFGSPVTKVETYDIDSIESDASANGIPTETITKFKDSKLNEDVDENEKFSAESNIFENTVDTTKSIKDIRKQRKNILKLAFANNPRRTKFKTTAASLGYTNLSKPNILVVKINFGKAEINLNEEKNVDDNTGFLIPIGDGEEATITNKEGTSKFKIIRDEISFGDGDGKYFVETLEQVSMITNFESNTYIRGSTPQGPFKDGDRAIIGGVPVLFGGITEDGGNYSFGDPYINPIFGSVTKLPDKKALYRLFQGLDIYINCSVDKISEKKQKFMEEWFYKKTGFDSKLFGFITSGYFYNKIYITSENHELFCDFDKQSMTMDEKDQEYFTISNTYGVEKENKFILNEKCSIYTISWPHKEYNNIAFTIKIYENPQIDNAVSIQVAGNIIDCKGLLVRNYKPTLMRISDIKIKKDKKLNKRVKKAKHKFSRKAIKDENEVWVKIKGT